MLRKVFRSFPSYIQEKSRLILGYPAVQYNVATFFRIEECTVPRKVFRSFSYYIKEKNGCNNNFKANVIVTFLYMDVRRRKYHYQHL